jgi:Xaa-Pro aminopeptidase
MIPGMLRASSLFIAALSVLAPSTASAQGDSRPPAKPKAPKLEAPKLGSDVPATMPAAVFRARREALLERLGACAALVPGARSGQSDVTDSFVYLTGMHEPGAALLLSPRQADRAVLLVPERDNDGNRLDVHLRARIRTELGFDRVLGPGDELARALPRAIRTSRCYATLRSSPDSPAIPKARLQAMLDAVDGHAQNRRPALEQMRAVKDEHELARMQKAAEFAIFAHKQGAALLPKRPTVRAVADAVDAALASLTDARVPAPSRVLSGPAAALLSDERGPDGKSDRKENNPVSGLVIIDSSAEYGDYTARVVRTYPVAGYFTATQRMHYEAVVAAHEQAITSIRSGVSLARIRKIAEAALDGAGYRGLPGGPGTGYAAGHFIGLAVRDVGDPDAPLDAGMVVVVETGILIPGQTGIRLADMVRVTARGQQLLTADLPRSPAGITLWQKR